MGYGLKDGEERLNKVMDNQFAIMSGCGTNDAREHT